MPRRQPRVGRSSGEVRVLSSVSPWRRGSNAFLKLFERSLPDVVDHNWFTWRRALLSNYDVLHVHWPEQLFRGTSLWKRVVTAFLYLALLLRLTVRGTPVVWTVHNATPHESGGPIERTFLRLLHRRVTRRVFLNSHHWAQLGAGSDVVIPHGTYRGWYPPPKESGEGAGLLFVGLIRPYKNVEGLLEAFRQLKDPTLTLTVRGRADDAGYAHRLCQMADEDERVELRFEFVSDGELSNLVSNAEALVLPYLEVGNSGVALLALSLGRPVIASRNPVIDELDTEVGPGWVALYDAPLTGDKLNESFNVLRDAARWRAAPDLTRREWGALGAAYADLFLEVATHRRSGGLCISPDEADRVPSGPVDGDR